MRRRALRQGRPSPSRRRIKRSPPWIWKTDFARSPPIVITSFMGRLPSEWLTAATLWRIAMPVAGAATESEADIALANHQFGRLEPSIWFKSFVNVASPRFAARPSRTASTAPVLFPRAALSRAIIAQASTSCGSINTASLKARSATGQFRNTRAVPAIANCDSGKSALAARDS